MSTTNTVTARVSPRFTTLLGLLFIGLKLGGVITWSWFWVLSPLWLPFAVLLGFLAAVGGIFVIAAAGDALGRRLR